MGMHRLLSSEEFYKLVNRKDSYVTIADIRPFKTGTYNGSAYDAYLKWFEVIVQSPLGQALT